MSPSPPGIYPLDLAIGGRQVHRIRLTGGGLRATLLTLGAALQDLRLEGVTHALTIGSPDPAAYLGAPFCAGVLVGPVANRISGGRARIGDRSFSFERNDRGHHTLHSGTAGTHTKIWDIAECSPDAVTLTRTLPDGEGGFPGTRRLSARFELTVPATLSMTLTATSDATTWINLANHSYWNLDGSPDYAGHHLQIEAERYCDADPAAMVTGALTDVTGTPLDFRQPRALRPGTDPVLDHNFCLSDARRDAPELALSLTGRSGIRMDVLTTEPGLQIFDGHILGGDDFPRHDRVPLAPYAGLAVEPQGWPDAPNQPHFPPVLLHPGERYRQITRWQFRAPA